MECGSFLNDISLSSAALGAQGSHIVCQSGFEDMVVIARKLCALRFAGAKMKN
jgi:hypothetical protein